MTTDPSALKEKVRSYVLNAVNVDKEKVCDDSLILKEGFFDSIGFITLISWIEQEFGVKTTDAELIEENFESINAISDFIGRKS